MKPEVQRCAIAKALGYELIVLGYESFSKESGLVKGEDEIWRTPSANKWRKELEVQEVKCVGVYFAQVSTGKIFADFDGPDNGVNGRGNFDYLNDLRAIYEAEKDIPAYQYGVWIARIVLGCREDFTDLSSDRDDWPFRFTQIAHATPSQRSEAFLRTLNIWTE